MLICMNMSPHQPDCNILIRGPEICHTCPSLVHWRSRLLFAYTTQLGVLLLSCTLTSAAWPVASCAADGPSIHCSLTFRVQKAPIEHPYIAYRATQYPSTRSHDPRTLRRDETLLHNDSFCTFLTRITYAWVAYHVFCATKAFF